MKKRVPRLKTDKQAEAVLAQELSGLDFLQFKPAKFEFEKKDDQINMRVPKPLLAAVKARAKAPRHSIVRTFEARIFPSRLITGMPSRRGGAGEPRFA